MAGPSHSLYHPSYTYATVWIASVICSAFAAGGFFSPAFALPTCSDPTSSCSPLSVRTAHRLFPQESPK
ncbi:hypothetical protein GRJ2_001408100 [Grus japonensis]|uniref:Uncharacterized protein n=1 Tax=Grus japonensis TaxID=30415 RepID=A0ABC9WVM2_GRUJA